MSEFFKKRQKASRRLEDLIGENLDYYLGPTGIPDKLRGINSLLNPLVGMGDAGTAVREGRPVDAITDTAGALLPVAGAVAAKPLVRGIRSASDEASSAIKEALTGGSFDSGRRAAVAGMAAAPVFGGIGAGNLIDDMLPSAAKKVAGLSPLSAKIAALKRASREVQELDIALQKQDGGGTSVSDVESDLLDEKLTEVEDLGRDLVQDLDNFTEESLAELSDEDFGLLLQTRDYNPEYSERINGVSYQNEADTRDFYLHKEATRRGVSDISASKRLDQVLGGDAGLEASQQVQDMISDLVRQKLPGVD